ncbi:hypothetical protein [Occallatibacter savannae]|uniref:hypothetical protein n=1 Tax=Occallatibacter savannae TaxID=1002691 RepID=UPI000D697327|nr:hypothetical protein [Occallatibacter savannae]
MFPLLKRASLLFVFFLPTVLYAGDYTYQQTTQITGGSLLKMMKTVGVFSSQARHMGDPVTSTIYLKGNQLADVSPTQIQIIDLDKETITQVDVEKKTWSVMTFDQMKQAIENARERMQQEQAKQQSQQTAQSPDAQNVQMSFDVKVRKTGATKDVSGLNSSEAILTMAMTATNTQKQQSGNLAITNDMWMVPSVPGYEQVREFYKKFALKMGDATVGFGRDMSRMLAQQPGANQAMGDMVKEMQKLDGVPVMQVMRMGTTANGQPLPAASEAPLPAEAPGPSKGEIAKAGMSSMISSKLGGFGGFGKKKKDTPPPDENAAQAGAQPTTAILMEMQTTTSNFSSGPVDPSHFEVPAGYQQVTAPMLEHQQEMSGK